MFKGAIVAIVTPFKNGKVDEGKLRELIEFQIANGTDGIVPCGTTGESPTLSKSVYQSLPAPVLTPRQKPCVLRSMLMKSGPTAL